MHVVPHARCAGNDLGFVFVKGEAAIVSVERSCVAGVRDRARDVPVSAILDPAQERRHDIVLNHSGVPMCEPSNVDIRRAGINLYVQVTLIAASEEHLDVTRTCPGPNSVQKRLSGRIGRTADPPRILDVIGCFAQQPIHRGRREVLDD
ncbi:MAG: hypothetical protein AB7Q29_17525 [Vicinamibacterales bacterium]